MAVELDSLPDGGSYLVALIYFKYQTELDSVEYLFLSHWGNRCQLETELDYAVVLPIQYTRFLSLCHLCYDEESSVSQHHCFYFETVVVYWPNKALFQKSVVGLELVTILRATAIEHLTIGNLSSSLVIKVLSQLGRTKQMKK